MELTASIRIRPMRGIAFCCVCWNIRQTNLLFAISANNIDYEQESHNAATKDCLNTNVFWHFFSVGHHIRNEMVEHFDIVYRKSLMMLWASHFRLLATGIWPTRYLLVYPFLVSVHGVPAVVRTLFCPRTIFSGISATESFHRNVYSLICRPAAKVLVV